MDNREAVNWLINISEDIGKAEHSDLWHYEQALTEIKDMLESAQPEERTDKRTETHACDLISRQAAIARAVPLNLFGREVMMVSVSELENLPPAQPEYEPVTAEDFAKTMSETTVYSYMVWHSEALALMEGQGFVICKKTI